MNFFKKILLIFFFILINTNLSANDEVAFVNVDLLFEKTLLGKSISSNLYNINSNNDKLLKSQKDELVKEENELLKIKNVISENEFNNKLSVLKNKVDKYNQEKDRLYKDFIETKNSELRIFFDKINPLLQAYLDEKKIYILFEKKNIFIGRSSRDITDELIKIIDKQFK
jgi:Skp family chaperone for outer membrane proteins